MVEPSVEAAGIEPAQDSPGGIPLDNRRWYPHLAPGKARQFGFRRFVVTGDPLERLGDRIMFMPDGCWHWTGALRNGYATAWVNQKTIRVHRFTYELLVGPIPDGLQLDHLCRVRHCVNPTHLEPVTSAENHRRSPYFDRESRTHCLRGHELTPDNTRVESNGYRRCRTCEREKTRVRRARARVLSPCLEVSCVCSH